MAEDYDTRPVFDVARIGERPREQPRPRLPTAPVRRSPSDAASVMGIPAEDLTPPVAAAITQLMAEIDHLRAAIEQHRHAEEWFDSMAHHHALAPVLNRRGLIRELGKLLTHFGQAELASCLVLLHVGGIERLRLLQGLAAGDAAIRHLGTAIATAVRQTDMVASLGGSYFVVVLTLADHNAAEAKGEEIVALVNQPAFVWEGQEMSFPVSLGLHELEPGDDPERAIAAADADRRRRVRDVARR